jgi:DoxX-like family
MITVRYAQALPEIRFNIATPGEIANRKWAATDMNNHTGLLTATHREPQQPHRTNRHHRQPCKEILMNLTLNLALWIAAGLLAVVLLVSSAKLVVPKEKMAGMGTATRWVEDFSPGALKAIGALELLAAAGLVLPAALDIAPVLVPLAAAGAVLLFVGAVIMRLRRGEKVTIVPDLVYLALAAFVAWGRSGPESFTG